MKLKEALNVLSKSSPYSVSTLRTGEPDSQLLAKEYLYVQSQIDRDFEEALKVAESGRLLFLCGSSGDGKSEVLTRLCRKIEFSDVVFHLDATHSKTQHGSAIDCLDKLFDRYFQEGFTLVVGINIGMIQKFIKYGADQHIEIKDLFGQFLKNRSVKGFTAGKVSFFNFESYPRISFGTKTISSDFVIDFLSNLTRSVPENPFWNAYLNDEKEGVVAAKNYKLLCDKSIQKGLINLLGLIRLYDEQFLVPRTFVDFIYKLIASDNPDGLVGNLFSSLENDISSKIQQHDPIRSRSEALDNYLLAKATDTLDQESIECSTYLNEFSGLVLSSIGTIRLASLLPETIQSKFPNSYFSDISNSLATEHYLELHRIFSKSELNESDEDRLICIIEEKFLGSVLRYINRPISQELNGYVLSREVEEFFICNKIDIALDVAEVERVSDRAPEFMTVPFLVNDDVEVTLDLDVKLMSLVNRIGSGFLPNRNLLNEYTKLDEFIRDIISATSKSEEVIVYRKSNLNIFYAEVKKGRRGYTLRGSCSVH